MSENSLIERYNYDSFVPEKFSQWMNFETSPAVGTAAPDFPLRNLDGTKTRLSAVWARYSCLIVEFGSFT